MRINGLWGATGRSFVSGLLNNNSYDIHLIHIELVCTYKNTRELAYLPLNCLMEWVVGSLLRFLVISFPSHHRVTDRGLAVP